MKILLAFILIIGFTACKKNNRSNELGSVNKDENISSKADPDSVRIVGELILRGEYIGGKNEKYIFPLMDSLSNQNHRQFYFKVFGRITEQADGYVAEAIGDHVLEYLQSAPAEFVQNTEVISDSSFNSMAYYAGTEISMSNQDLAKANEEFEKLRTQAFEKCSNILEPDKLKLGRFFNQMKQRIDPALTK